VRAVRLACLTLGLIVALIAPVATAVAPAASDAPPTMRLSVMSLNIFYGGDDFDLATSDWCPVANDCPQALHRLARIVEKSGADIVGVQEPERNTRRLADLLGWYASPQAHVISRFPILDPPDADGLYTLVTPAKGHVVAVANVHLPSTPYGPYQVRKGWPRHEVLELERTLRLAALAPVLRELPNLAGTGIPVFLTGDFNSPSHLDWTPAVAASRVEVPYAVSWPASRALADAGFLDSYRDAHPDPVLDPGYTWSPGGPETRPHDFFDRIDWVLHAGPSTTVSSMLVGEQGNPQVDLAFANPFPTDHRGVVSTFDVTPAESPMLVSPERRRVVVGDEPLSVRFHGTGSPHEVVALVPGSNATSPLMSAVSTQGRTDGIVRLSKADLRPGRYHIVLIDTRTGSWDARAPVWVYASGARPRLRTSASSYRVGDAVRVHFSGAPGNNLDWIGLFRCHRICDGPGGYLVYRYTRTHIEGSVVFGSKTYLGEGVAAWPLPPGRYLARLLVDDSYHAIGKSPRFTITK
jgi:endonuclease/exonuclease/phosphatase family metal-dependent hydrolase